MKICFRIGFFLVIGMFFLQNISQAQGKWAMGITAKNELHGGYGVLAVQEFSTITGKLLTADFTGSTIDKITSAGAFFFGYRFHPNKKLGLGLTGAFENINVFYEDPEVAYRWKSYALMLDSRFYYLYNPLFHLYSGVNAGYVSFRTNSHNQNASRGGFAFQVNAVGVRFGKDLGFFGELGFGYMGFLNGGISVRF